MMNRRKRFNRRLMAANYLLVAAVLSQRILFHYWHIGEDRADFMTGLLYGMMIALSILGLRQMRREDGHASGCA
jgi:hypothetical protein